MEEIIVDGVDISGCKYLNREYEADYPEMGGYRWFNNCELHCLECDMQSKNCYYKQLKRKEAECEELKKDLRNVEKDRAWIKEKCIDAGKELGKHSFAWDGKEKNLVIQALYLNEMYEKQKQALEKIEEEMKIINKCEYCADWKNGYCRGFNECTCDCFKKIGNIIKECKE